MNIRFITASECQQQSHQNFKDVPELLCLDIPNPTKETNELATAIDDELGYYSKSYTAYIKSLPKVDPKTRTNVINEKNKRVIGNYVLPVTVGGNVSGLFYYPKIKPQVEAVVEKFIASKSQKKS